MNISGKFLFNASQETSWRLLMDIDAVTQALPWVTAMEPLNDLPFSWRATAQIAFYSTDDIYTGLIHIRDIEAPEQYRMSVQGEGEFSHVGGSALLTLSYRPDLEKTLLTWQGQVSLSGRLAELSPNLIRMGASMTANLFFSRLAKQLPSS
jgi:carbon monoxide dehydrogenase subunit G